MDATFALWNEGYEFIWNRCRRFQSDLFVTRLLGRTTICMHGRDAAEVFFDETKFRRRAVPRRVVTSLFGMNGSPSPDDAEHLQLEAPFIDLSRKLDPELLMGLMTAEWRRAIRRWERARQIVLFDEVQLISTRAACEWAAVPLNAADVRRRARDLGLMVDACGGMGPRLWKGTAARHRTERWMTRVIEEARSEALQPRQGSALQLVAELRATDGSLLPAEIGAVHLINVIRPVVALPWYITFAALALREQPRAREQIAREPVGEGAGAYATMFMQEVRRYYPFTPYFAAKVRSTFEWRGQRFEQGTLVLLDVYGTNHDPALWDHPEEFRPERFRSWRFDPFSLVPRVSSGEPKTSHRRLEEAITLHGLTLALHFLTRCVTYRVPKQDLGHRLRRMPTRPKSGFVMRDIRATPALEGPAPRLPSEKARPSRPDSQAAPLTLH